MRLLFVLTVYGPIAQAVDGLMPRAHDDTREFVSALLSGAVLGVAGAAIAGLLL